MRILPFHKWVNQPYNRKKESKTYDKHKNERKKRAFHFYVITVITKDNIQ